MTNQKDLCAPWTLAWDRDGTEDYGTIFDADGHEIVTSHLCKTCWLPEQDGEKIPDLLRQLWVMEAAPNLLAMLKIAVATADPKRHKWVKEAQAAIAKATGQPFDTKEARAAWYMHKASSRMCDALKKCEAILRDYAELIHVADKLLKPQGELPNQIEEVRREAFAAFSEAQGYFAF